MSPTLSQVRVWLVRESVCISTDPTQDSPRTEQDLFVLATSLEEAIEIVGSLSTRRIVAVQEVCPITIMETNKWRIVPKDKP